MIYQHLYVHIPFCQRRCSYCDFNTFANSEGMMEAYSAALSTQIRRMGAGEWQPEHGLAAAARLEPWPAPALEPQRHARRDLAGPLRRADLPSTLFLGGGTPTALPLALLERIMQACDEVLPLAGAEVTSEANPGTVLDQSYLRGMRAMGINRLSMGVQSLDDSTLKTLGRIHTAAEARASYELALRSGFESVNLDFIFGLPGQTLAQWRETLRELVRWQPPHLSLYSLILEEGTPLAEQVAAGRFGVPDDDLTGAMYELAMELLGTAGYVQYEISNWALPGSAPVAQTTLPAHACLHNLAYWLNADYLGCGAGAHSHSQERRWSDLRALGAYIKAVEQGRPPIDELTPLQTRDVEIETMLMGLRLSSGVGEQHFRERCGRTLDQAWGAQVAELLAQGLLERDQHAVRLTWRGRMVANSVLLRFL